MSTCSSFSFATMFLWPTLCFPGDAHPGAIRGHGRATVSTLSVFRALHSTNFWPDVSYFRRHPLWKLLILCHLSPCASISNHRGEHRSLQSDLCSKAVLHDMNCTWINCTAVNSLLVSFRNILLGLQAEASLSALHHLQQMQRYRMNPPTPNVSERVGLQTCALYRQVRDTSLAHWLPSVMSSPGFASPVTGGGPTRGPVSVLISFLVPLRSFLPFYERHLLPFTQLWVQINQGWQSVCGTCAVLLGVFLR